MKRFANSAFLGAFCAVLCSAGSAWASTIAEYNPDDLAAGPSPSLVMSMKDDSESGNTLTSTAYPTLYGSGTTGYNTIFNGRNYVNFASGNSMNTASALFSGAGARSIAVAFDTPSTAGTGNGPGNGFNANIAGEQGNQAYGAWFSIESRDNNVTGDPYLVNAGPDVNSGVTPTANQLTFAVATYDGTTENLYWTFGTSPSSLIGSASVVVGLTTNYSPFYLGSDTDGLSSPSQIGQVLVYNTGLSSSDAMSEIRTLQTYYSPVPEPSSVVLLLLGGVGACLLYRRGRRRA